MSDETKKSYEFQSEVKQLLHILAYSLYKHKEVFLRELISNAVDALNKVQFEMLTDAEVEERDLELKISISFDKKHSKLIVEDTGIGMTREELVENIGTIAHSGTLGYLSKLAAKEGKEAQPSLDLIGKFGVGFYSSFMVAKEIHIQTRSYKKGSQSFLWKSQGEKEFTIEPGDRKTRGTRIDLFLKKDEKEYLEASRIKGIILKHSKFVPFPIYVDGEKIERMEAIWTQPKINLKEKDYLDFYHFFENTQDDPAAHLHLSSDAPVQFTALFYVPKTSLEMLLMTKMEPGVDLYSHKVLIQKGSKDLLPDYLRFVRGIIDSEEIPLNISRESVQSNVKIEKIRKHVTKKLIEHLEAIKEKEADRYKPIWKNFGRNLKEGVLHDYENRERLARMLLFTSSKTGKDETIDLHGYVGRMKPEQKDIYYATGSDTASIRANPALEIFKKKDFEVLFLTDPLDEFCLEQLHEFEKRPFKMIESADVQLEKEEQKAQAGAEQMNKFVAYLKSVYGDRVQDVRVSQRLVDSPCMLAQPAEAPSAQMEKVIKMVNKEYQFAKRIFEVNPGHPLIQKMADLHAGEPASELLRSVAMQLLDNMLLREGVLDDIEASVSRIQQIMLESLPALGRRAEGL